MLDHVFPPWARLITKPTSDPDIAFDAAFSAGASLALLDQIMRENPPFAGTLRQRLALRAATACARIARTKTLCVTPNI